MSSLPVSAALIRLLLRLPSQFIVSIFHHPRPMINPSLKNGTEKQSNVARLVMVGSQRRCMDHQSYDRTDYNNWLYTTTPKYTEVK